MTLEVYHKQQKEQNFKWLAIGGSSFPVQWQALKNKKVVFMIDVSIGITCTLSMAYSVVHPKYLVVELHF